MALKNQHPLKHLLYAVKLAKSVFYYHVSALKKPTAYGEELARIETIYHEHKGRYGYRRIHLTLKNEGIMLNHKTVQRLMGQLGLKSTVRPKKYRSYRGETGKTVSNHLKRDFTASKPDEKWVTDVTEFKVNGQRVYLSPIIDLFNQEVVAYRLAKNARLTLVTGMLESGLSQLTQTQKPLLHSDQAGSTGAISTKNSLLTTGFGRACPGKGTAWITRLQRIFSVC